MASQIGQRLAFQNASNAVKRAGQSPANAVLSQSYLRLETGLVAGNTQYKFDILVNENTQTTNYNTQLKLNLQDSFIVSQIGFFLATPASATDATYRLLTYPNKTAFGATNSGYANTLYNGYMSLTINQRTIIPNWDLYKHLDVPTTQQNMVTATFATTAGAGLLAEDQNNADDFGFFPCEPNIVLVGSKKNDLTVTLPAGLTAVTANSRLVCIFRGILAQNTTSVN
jgi:hypothetical protein